MSGVEVFAEEGYRVLDRARVDHLLSLGLLQGRSILDVGSGGGGMTRLLRETGLSVTASDARPWLVAALPPPAVQIDIETVRLLARFDVVLAYGLLYHLAHPFSALAVMAHAADRVLVVETCVGEVNAFNLPEDAEDPRNGVRGLGCRPSRDWLQGQMSDLMPHVGWPVTQPNHEEFPLDWRAPLGPGNHRCVVVGSRLPLNPAMFCSGPLDRHEVCRG